MRDTIKERVWWVA